jgi:hypothetical protein
MGPCRTLELELELGAAVGAPGSEIMVSTARRPLPVGMGAARTPVHQGVRRTPSSRGVEASSSRGGMVLGLDNKANKAMDKASRVDMASKVMASKVRANKVMASRAREATATKASKASKASSRAGRGTASKEGTSRAGTAKANSRVGRAMVGGRRSCSGEVDRGNEKECRYRRSSSRIICMVHQSHCNLHLASELSRLCSANLVLGEELGVSVCERAGGTITRSSLSTHHVRDAVLDRVDVPAAAARHLSLLDVELKVSIFSAIEAGGGMNIMVRREATTDAHHASRLTLQPHLPAPAQRNTNLKNHMVQCTQLLVAPLGRHLIRERLVAERARRVDKRAPVELGEETTEKVEVLLRGADDDLDFGELEREVVLGAVAWDVSCCLG